MRVRFPTSLAVPGLGLLLGCGVGRTPAERACIVGRQSIARGEQPGIQSAELRGPLLVPNVPLPADLEVVDAAGSADTVALGALTVSLLVDSLGGVMPGSVQVLESPTPEIAQAFAESAAGWRFRPAELAPGCPVGSDVRMRFQLRWLPGKGLTIDPARIA